MAKINIKALSEELGLVYKYDDDLKREYCLFQNIVLVGADQNNVAYRSEVRIENNMILITSTRGFQNDDSHYNELKDTISKLLIDYKEKLIENRISELKKDFE